MDPTIIVLGIRALLRIAREGQSAYEQYQRDKPVLFPAGLGTPATALDFLRKVFSRHREEIENDGAYARYWKGTKPDPAAPGAADVLLLRAVQLDAVDNATAAGAAPTRRLEVGGAAMIQQWADDRAPVGPVGRMVTCLADVALEFVGARSSVLGAGGNGEKLIGAFAGRLATLIPDDAAARGPRSQLAERAVGVFLRAGLQALDARSDGPLDGDVVGALVQQTLPPLLAALPGDFATDLVAQSRWTTIADALLGPTAGAAMTVLARNPGGFPGSSLDAGALVGRVTQALLGQAGTTGLHQPLGPAGFVAVLRAALGAAEARPARFADPDAAPELFRHVATALRNLPPPFDGDLAGDLAAAALHALPGADAPGEPWQPAVAAMVTAVANGLRPALAGGALARVLSSRQLLDLATILLRQAGTPGMLAAGRTELEAIARGVASAIAGDERGLLAPDDWLAVARIAATQAAANPGRLFPLAASSPGAGPAADLIAVLLASGRRDVERGRDGGAVLFGATLRDAIVCTLRAQTGRAGAAVDRPAAVAALAGRLNALAADEPGRYGSREWLALYRALLPRALRGDPVDAVPQDALDRLLAGEGIA